MFDEFNPDSTVRLLPILSVLKKSGLEIPINNRIVEFDAGAPFVLDIDDETGEIIVGTNNEDNLYHQQKYEALRDLVPGGTPSGPFLDPATGITPDGPAWAFTDASYYISKIADKPPEGETGVSFMVNDACSNYIQGTNQLTLIDICGPCLDCPTYETLQTYLERIEEMIRYVWRLTGDKITDTVPVAPNGTPLENFTGIYLQALTALNYWNYMVHKQSVKANAQSFGQSISAAAYYRNVSPGNVGPINIQVKFRFLQRIGGGGLSTWDGVSGGNTEVRVVDREGQPSASLDSGPVYTASTITVQLDAGTLNSGDEIYGDTVLMITDTSLFDNEADQILIVVETTFDVTHIGNNILLSDTIYFRATDGAGSAGSS